MNLCRLGKHHPGGQDHNQQDHAGGALFRPGFWESWKKIPHSERGMWEEGFETYISPNGTTVHISSSKEQIIKECFDTLRIDPTMAFSGGLDAVNLYVKNKIDEKYESQVDLDDLDEETEKLIKPKIKSRIELTLDLAENNTLIVKGRVHTTEPDLIYSDQSPYENWIASFTRNIKIKDGDKSVVDHHFFSVDEEYQGTGFGTEFFFRAEDAYRQSQKIRSVEVFADLEVGGYAWAVMGFDFSSSYERQSLIDTICEPQNLKEKVPGTISENKELTDAGRELVDAISKCKYPYQIAAITLTVNGKEFPAGKKLLVGSEWNGVKTLLGDTPPTLEAGNQYREKVKKKKLSKHGSGDQSPHGHRKTKFENVHPLTWVVDEYGKGPAVKIGSADATLKDGKTVHLELREEYLLGIHVRAKEGNRIVGRAWFNETFRGYQGGNAATSVEVNSTDKRRGIATAMYDAVEHLTGKTIEPADGLSPEARQFWRNRREETTKHGTGDQSPHGHRGTHTLLAREGNWEFAEIHDASHLTKDGQIIRGALVCYELKTSKIYAAYPVRDSWRSPAHSELISKISPKLTEDDFVRMWAEIRSDGTPKLVASTLEAGVHGNPEKSLDNVYRALDELEKHGLITPVEIETYNKRNQKEIIPTRLAKSAWDESQHARDEYGKFSSKLVNRLEQVRDRLAESAQSVLDEWEPDEDGYDELFGGGGACDEIARAMSDVLAEVDGIEVMDGGQDGDDHAWLIALDHERGEAYGVDIPPGVYESGAGYSWKKHSGAKVKPEDVEFFKLNYNDITKENWT